jgi:hypothetical protein
MHSSCPKLTCTHTHTCSQHVYSTFLSSHTCIHAHSHMHIHIHTYITCWNTHRYSHAHTQVHTHTHTHTHSLTHMFSAVPTWHGHIHRSKQVVKTINRYRVADLRVEDESTGASLPGNTHTFIYVCVYVCMFKSMHMHIQYTARHLGTSLPGNTHTFYTIIGTSCLPGNM